MKLRRAKRSDVTRTTTYGFRFPPELKKRIDEYAGRLSAEMGNVPISRAFAVMRLIAIGLDVEDRKRKRRG